MRTFFLGLILLLTLAIPTKADLSIDGPKNLLNLINQTYEKMPERGKSNKVTVHVISQKTMSEREGEGVLGVYYLQSHEFWIVDTEEYVDFVFAHEYSHFIYFEVFTDEERAEWNVFWNNWSGQGLLPRDYAEVNEVEGFAECMMMSYIGRVPEWYKPLYPEIEAEVKTLIHDKYSLHRT